MAILRSQLCIAAVLAAILVATGNPAQAQLPEYTAADSVVARMWPVGTEVEIVSAASGDTMLVNALQDLYQGDIVLARRQSAARIVYDAPPSCTVETTFVVTSAHLCAASEAEPQSSLVGDAWASFWRTMSRLKGEDVAGPIQLAHGAVRGDENASLLFDLPPKTKLLERPRQLTWFTNAEKSDSARYHLALFEEPDSVQCWREGNELWETSVTDTSLADSSLLASLKPGGLYRIELWSDEGTGDYTCLEVADGAERRMMLEKEEYIREISADRDLLLRDVIWSGVLLESGYHADAAANLRLLLNEHPNFSPARQLWRVLASEVSQR